MKGDRVFITGMGIVSSLGSGVQEHYDSLRNNRSGIKPLTLFPLSEGNRHPAGEITGFEWDRSVPRTHGLALAAAKEALSGRNTVPDAVIIGTTTGGMALTEELLRKGEKRPDCYRYHSTSSVAEYCAAALRCPGLIVTVTNACSSGSAAIKLALELLRTGKATCVLAGGADSLCRLTYYGFNSLQLIDPEGSRPLDRSRRGMSVAEGSAMVLLEASASAPEGAIAEVLGGGLSCDAHHPATPHPEGAGALAAMGRAIEDAGTASSGIEYINLHGTGTKDNDLAEAAAIRALFGGAVPPLSSIKGATGHSLAAAGAIEAVVCSMVIRDGFIPGNTGCTDPDPELKVSPVLKALDKKTGTVLSNSFGFGGNNACLVLGDPAAPRKTRPHGTAAVFEILGGACVTGAGDLARTIASLQEGKNCGGTLPLPDISKNLPAREVRRLKRLPRLALALALDARNAASQDPASIFFGTAWGPLSETYDFLTKLYESDEQFTSPTDFVGSVHNAPAGQIAIWLKATGANITATGGDYSFEQSLFAASLAAGSGETLLVMGADEHHEELSPLFDGSVRAGKDPADGGGALILKKTESPAGPCIAPLFFENYAASPGAIASLVRSLGGADGINATCAAVFAGMPGGEKASCRKQLDEFLDATGYTGPVIDYRALLGEFGTVTAAAAAVAAQCAKEGMVPAALASGAALQLRGKRLLMVGLGSFVTAMEITA
ncbi:MAG TPA: beta-ketoacyl synthase N-terminal-like domain-containing protein [Spirochaetota bacterium]|nr:beta-ketoacyl synthase N-terminal-like domain-containing protein [Spirochaetota bacterium]HPC40092.1 beta-ketoacyl synthase N-terminal-like domain-containing protein [Spirochaetota bacterium]